MLIFNNLINKQIHILPSKQKLHNSCQPADNYYVFLLTFMENNYISDRYQLGVLIFKNKTNKQVQILQADQTLHDIYLPPDKYYI